MENKWLSIEVKDYWDDFDYRPSYNCKQVLIRTLKTAGDPKISCAFLNINYVRESVMLKRDYTSRELLKFYLELDIVSNEMLGTIWLDDGSWIEFQKGFHTGHHKCPEIPKEL